MTGERERISRGILFAGSAAFAVLAVIRLPVPREMFRPPRTPFDRTESSATAPEYLFLTHAAAVVPRGAVVTVRSEPRDPTRETVLHFKAVALLPGRRVLPAAAWNVYTPEYDAQADYVLVFGPPPPAPPGRPILSDPNGTVWKRAP
jgi:hypothetical protein